MPRRNSIGHSRRRTTRRPEPEHTEAAVNYEALARELVTRGLASPAVLSGAHLLPTKTHGEHSG